MLTGFLSQIAQADIQNFLIEHEHDDEKVLVLKQKEIGGVPSSIIASQLSVRRKAKSKLPTWYKTKGIIYPPTTNLEQSSSEATAIYKTAILNSCVSTKRVAADLTGGFGVDSFFLSTLFDSIYYVEPNAELFGITKHNHQQLGASNIIHHNLSAEEFIEQTELAFDLVYIDPSRRDDRARKVYKLADCFPDITTLQQTLSKKSKFVLIKASPLLDIQQGLREISHVKRVFVVSVGNECKELLFLAERNYEGEPQIDAIDLWDDGRVRSSFSFTFPDERVAQATLGEPEMYLYEPTASILKSGAFKGVAEKFGLTKLDVNTHLYTSSVMVPDFPGKMFLIESLHPDAKQLKALLPESHANVVSRNYPLTPEEIKKRFRLRDGGQKFLIGFSSSKKKYLALCSRITGI
jgi:16S rRNA G966 N2-methylase RsmD